MAIPPPPPVQEWRQNTWGGWAVRQVQAVARVLFLPFFEAVHAAAGSDMVTVRVVAYVAPRLGVVILAVAGGYGVGKLVQLCLGKEVTVVETVVVVHEYDTEEEAEAARREAEAAQAATGSSSGGGRGKKQKQTKPKSKAQ